MNIRSLIRLFLFCLLLTPEAARSQVDRPPLAVPSWFGAGVAAALLDPTPGIRSNVLALPGAAEAFRELRLEDVKQRAGVVSELVKQLQDPTFDPTDAAAAAATALADINPGDSKQRESVVAVLLLRVLNAQKEPFSLTPAAAARTLGRIGLDHDQRDVVVNELIRSLYEEDRMGHRVPEIKSALARIASEDPTQNEAIITALLKRIDDATDDPTGAKRERAAEAVGAITTMNSMQRALVITALLRRVNDLRDDPTNVARSGAAKALGEISTDDLMQREAIFKALFSRIEDSKNDASGWVRYNSIIALQQINPKDKKQRDPIIDELIKLSNTASGDLPIPVRTAATIALGDFRPDDSKRLELLVSTLLKRLDKANIGQDSPYVVEALTKIAMNDAEQRNTIVAELLTHLSDNFPPNVDPQNANPIDTVAIAAARSLASAADGGDVKQRDKIVSGLIGRLDDTSDASDGLVRGEVAEALGTIASEGVEQRDSIAAALIRHLGEPKTDRDGAVRAGAARALGIIASKDPGRRDAIIFELLERLEDPINNTYGFLPSGLIEGLSLVTTSKLEQRKAIVTAVLKHLDDMTTTQSVARALLRFDPLDLDQIITILKAMYRDAPNSQRTAYWRAQAISYAGAVTQTDPSWVFLRYMGRPTQASIPWDEVNGKPATGIGYLKQINDHWPALKGSDRFNGLEEEAALRVLEIVEHSCPLSSKSSTDHGWYETASDILHLESTATWNWIVSLILSDRALRCWTQSDRQILTSLLSHVQTAELKNYATPLSEHINSERAAPRGGLALMSYIAWGVPSLLLIVAFPRSTRVRALYLYNDWARAILSLGWIPLLVSLSPQLRARLLGPFKSDLLADAGLKDFKEEYWYSGSRVIDQDGKERFLAEAIRQIAGNMVLIGESGLGKTTFLRLLATRSRGALVFLNATSCDKGVLEAIVRKTKEFQNINFFRYLTETRDLSIIVDGLNEVSADVRAIIVKFANDFRNSNILISTQPIESVTAKRSSFDNATFYELCPLNRDDIKGFLISRPRSGGGGRAGQSCSYRRAVRQFLSSELDSARTVEERQAAQLILSNPMDLTYASELLSLGTIPRPTGMIGQAFRLARADYESYSKIDFPASKFADKTVEMRNENRNWLYEDEFSNVQKALERFRLMVRRSVRGRDGKETTGLIFRHDKVWDFFMQIAFAANEEFQVTYMDDPRFRGVYLLFAQSADVLTARRLRDLVVHRAAETQDHTLSDEFVRRLAVRDPDSYPNRPSTGTQQKAGSRKEDDETGSLPRN